MRQECGQEKKQWSGNEQTAWTRQGKNMKTKTGSENLIDYDNGKAWYQMVSEHILHNE